MRKYLLLSFMLILLGESKAQYYPMLGDSSTTWCQVYNIILVRSSDRNAPMYDFLSLGDTLIAGNTYKKTVAFPHSYVGALREDSLNRKVYYVNPNDSAEQVIYDFNLNLNDSIFLTFNPTYSVGMSNGYYIVDSVNTVNIRGGLRKYLRLYNPLNTDPDNVATLEWIESVGDIHNPLYLYNMDGSSEGFSPITFSCPGNEHHFMVVIKHELDEVRNYVNVCAIQHISGSVSSDTCEVSYAGYVESFENTAHPFKIYPNPSNSTSTVTLSSDIALPQATEVRLTDISGRQVLQLNCKNAVNEMVFQPGNIEPGIYVVTISSKGKVLGQTRLVRE